MIKLACIRKINLALANTNNYIHGYFENNKINIKCIVVSAEQRNFINFRADLGIMVNLAFKPKFIK